MQKKTSDDNGKHDVRWLNGDKMEVLFWKNEQVIHFKNKIYISVQYSDELQSL